MSMSSRIFRGGRWDLKNWVTGLISGGAEIRPKVCLTLSVGYHQWPLKLLQAQPIPSGGRVREKRTEQRRTSSWAERGPGFPGALQQLHMSHPQALPGEGQGSAGLWSVWRWEGVLGFRNPLGHYLEPKTVFMVALTPHTFCLDWEGSQEAHISHRVTVIDWCQCGQSSVLLDEAKESLPRSWWSPLWGACLSCHCHSCHLKAL